MKTNVWISIDDLFKRSAEVRALVKAGKLTVIGAVYDLATGAVNFMGTHPEQGRLLAYTGGAVLGSLDWFPPMWIHRQDYDEEGRHVVTRRCV